MQQFQEQMTGRANHGGGKRPGRMQIRLGEEAYLWLLVGLEVLSLAWLRHAFRRSHGG